MIADVKVRFGATKVCRSACSLCTFAGLVCLFIASDCEAATDPCAGRDFAGRIVIIFKGAGEREDSESPMEAIDANAAIKNFIGDSPVLVPSVILSSDPKVREGRRFSSAKATGAVATFESSKESFQKVVASDGYLAGIKEQLAASELFKKLVRPGEDVSKYLKIEIVIASHSSRWQKSERLNKSGSEGFKGLPIWTRDGERGSDRRHLYEDAPVLTRADWQPLYSIFPNAVVQAFVASCDSADVGEMIGPDSSAPEVCYCFSALVGKGRKAPGKGDPLERGQFNNDALSVFGAHIERHSIDNTWQGAESACSVNFAFLDGCRLGVGLTGHEWVSPIFAIDPTVDNPFDSISWTSLETLIDSLKDGPKPRGFGSGIGSALPTTTQRSLISNLFGGLETCFEFPSPASYAPLSWTTVVDMAYIRGHKTFLAMQAELQAYFPSMTDKEKNATMVRMMRKAEENGVPVADLLKRIVEFANRPAYAIGPKDGRMPLKEVEQRNVLSALREMHAHFVDVERFNQIILDTGYAEGDNSATERVLKDFNEPAARFHQSFLSEYFPDLVRDSFGRRLQKAKDVLEGLADEGSAESLKKIQAIQSQVSCLTDVPVGPAFDRKYILPKLPTSRRIPVKGPGISRAGDTDPQFYLLTPAESDGPALPIRH